MDEDVVEASDLRPSAGPDDHHLPPVMETLKAEARQRGLFSVAGPVR